MNSPLRNATAGAASASSGDMPVSRREPEPFERRVLPKVPDASLDEYIQRGGGAGLSAARAVTPDVVVGELIASGLRGRGGAGFPTGVKWRTMLENTSQELRTSVVVNAAEGEPGTFKDRAILEANPYAVLEGALIAAVVLDASSVVIAIKKSFEDQIRRLRRAIAEISNAGWSTGVEVRIVEGPNEYLFGEETALLEVVDGRDPFPRIAPPYRRGSVEVVASDDDVDSGSGLAADVHMAAPGVDNVVPPTLVSNVETFANIAAIVARGAEWFRSIGTAESPGTIVSTVTGAVRHPGVGEVPMGTRLADLIELVGGGLIGDTRMRAVLVGVSGAVIGPNELDVAVSYEAMAAIGSGVGSAGFIVVSDEYSAIDVAAGVSRFLAIESCGQCTPCKVDGLRISAGLYRGPYFGGVKPSM